MTTIRRLGERLAAFSRLPGALARRIAGDSDDPDTLIRAHAFVWYASILGVLAVGWGSTHYQYGSTTVAMVFYLSGLLVVTLVVKVARDRRLRFACHAMMAAALALTAVANTLTGGLRMTNVCALFMIVVASVFLLGRPGLIWSIGAIAVGVAFEVAHGSGVEFPDAVPPAARPLDAFMTWFLAASVVLSFVLAYEVARERTVRLLRRANRAKTMFLANVSHELRTPIHAIMGMNRTVVDRGLDDVQRAAIETSQQQAETLLVFMDDLLDLAAAERGRFSLREADFNPVFVVESTTHVLRVLGEGQGLRVGAEVDPAVPRWVRGDARRLRQVLTNVGANAVKFTSHGSVHLSVEPIEGRELGCRFRVRDTGAGISVADQRRIFESFARAGNPLTQERGGSGLGLSIARELVELMGGTIFVDSELGAGSTFTVELQFAPPACAHRAESESPIPRLKVLLVEDIDLNRDLAEAMLRSADHAVVVAKNGEQAIELWELENPDVILMDIKMPGMDGLSATRSIRERERQAKRKPVRIVAMTGQATEQERIGCLEAGMDECLFKPFSPSDLAAVLRRSNGAPPV